MTDGTTDSIRFTSCRKRKVEAEFGGGEISSDAGAMLLSEADKVIGLCDRVASIVDNPRPVFQPQRSKAAGKNTALK